MMSLLELDLEEGCESCGHDLRLQVKEQEDGILSEFSCLKCGFKFTEANKHVTLIGDAGMESLVGGCVIGVYDLVSKEFESKTIGVEHFQNFLSEESRYLDEVVAAVDKIFTARNINPDTHLILITNTHLMSKLRTYLNERHYSWFRFKTSEPLASLTRKAFEEHLLSIGIPEEGLKMQGRAKLNFLLSWVMSEESREKLVKKTGL